MTGFARREASADGCNWTWEVRSVNSRGLEMRCRLPVGFEGLEPAVRQRVTAVLKRGNVLATLSFGAAAGETVVRVNESVLEQILALLPRIRERIEDASAPDVAAILGLRGVIEVQDGMPTGDARRRLEADILSDFDRVLAALVEQRRAEGDRLAPVLAGQIARIGSLCGESEALAAVQPEAIFARLKEQVAALIGASPALTAERLGQEAAVLAVKADPREEIDRIKSHVEAAGTLLTQSGPVGRQLDFVCQELNREANTLCAKSADVALTRIGIELKTTVDQLREQVQNIE